MAVAVFRFALLLLLWVAIAGAAPADLPVGAAGSAIGAWASLRLIPPARITPRPAALAMLVLRFPWQALRAGVEVASIALDPRRRAAPATIAWTPRLPPGPARDAFLAYASLLPGTLPAGEMPGGAIAIHALDGSTDVAAAMTLEETRFTRAFGLDG
ncbi:Na+/H+ antiporter subunit E [Roseomonas terrae]|jgi:multicomponent Na+:H+ antiporter subunit E|uniref:Na+/H+ antiporter subunit E n=1 Tax=Neoroseomonas terrae TaxID=424799 RepID=A0ABS5EGW7_9PROT|nr:Na+/H+ antiporter subunit E [Neoroseomonas terrae]MBR0650260.1 Na+/H+ antiporter subunit E [Neoroseomonas terrae]